MNTDLKELLKMSGIPVAQDEYLGREDKYIIFSYEDERPAAHADNCVTADTFYIQVQLVTPKSFNYLKMKNKIRSLLEGADFVVKSIRSFLGDTYQGTEKIRQTVFSVEYTGQRMEE